MKRYLPVILIFAALVPLYGQDLNSIYENNSLVSFEKYVYSSDSIFHTSIRPYRITGLKNALAYDSIKDSYSIKKFQKKKALNLIFNRNLFLLQKKEYGFTIDP